MNAPARKPLSLRKGAFLLLLAAATAWILLKPSPLQTDEGEAGGCKYHITYRAKINQRGEIERTLHHLRDTLPPADTVFTRRATQALQRMFERQRVKEYDIRLSETEQE